MIAACASHNAPFGQPQQFLATRLHSHNTMSCWLYFLPYYAIYTYLELLSTYFHFFIYIKADLYYKAHCSQLINFKYISRLLLNFHFAN